MITKIWTVLNECDKTNLDMHIFHKMIPANFFPLSCFLNAINHKRYPIPLEKIAYMYASRKTGLSHLSYNARSHCKYWSSHRTAKIECVIGRWMSKMRQASSKSLGTEIRPLATEGKYLSTMY